MEKSGLLVLCIRSTLHLTLRSEKVLSMLDKTIGSRQLSMRDGSVLPLEKRRNRGYPQLAGAMRKLEKAAVVLSTDIDRC